ncbi:hypothetical protein niasHS_017739 [Heterodera schachtii]|uniref:RING-type domain-containing protein n=1 Tax=Heterodera schachtii TaxID=97005 RepID=A0ABD2I6E8_HETSC
MDSYTTVNNEPSVTGPTEEDSVLSATATTAVHISSPPPLLISPSATSVRLSSGLRLPQGGDDEGPSRGPKLRRLASFGDQITSQSQFSGQVATTDLAEFRSPSVVSASSAATNVAAALVHLQQHAAVAAAIPSTVTLLSSFANALPSSTASVNSQQRHLSQQLQLVGETSLSSPSSIVPSVADSNIATFAADLGSAVSLSAGVEQIVAAAINTATATLPQTIAAIAAASGFPPQNAAAVSPCAVCAAAACQSRMGSSMAAAVTACSCLHHHHHHLHCHHNTVLPASPFPVCTLCNHVAGGVSPSPSSTTSMAQPQQNLHSSNSHQTSNMNNSCINATGTSMLGNSHGNNRFVTNGSDVTLQSNVQIRPIAALNSSAFIGSSSSGGMGRVPLTNNISANVNINATSGGSAAMVAAAALSPSNVIAMLLNSAAAMGQQQNQLPQMVHTTPYGLRNFSAMDDFAAVQSLTTVTSMQQNILANRLVQQEREREAVNHFNQQHQNFPLMDEFAVAQSLPNLAPIQQSIMANRLAQQEREREAVNHFNQQQQHFPLLSDFAAAAQSLPNVTSMQQNILATRLVQQEREREAVNNFYQQQQQRAVQQNHLVRPLIMVPRLSSQLDLANVLLLHNPESVDDAATLVLNGGSSVTSALAHAANPHHIVANAMATATAPEPQPVGVSLEQIKKHSQKLSYVKDPDVPEQERDRCTVCLCDFDTDDELRALNCTHLFHTECIDRWLQYNKKCPVCRVDMDKGGAGSSAMAAEAAVMLNAYAAAAAASTTSNTTSC